MTRLMTPLVALVLALGACGGDDQASGTVDVEPGNPFGNYEDQNISVIGAPNQDLGSGTEGASIDPADAPDALDTPVLVGTPEGDPAASEVCVSDSLCESPAVDESNWCEREGGPVDLIYIDGELVDTICYPPADDPERSVETVDTTAPGEIEVAQMASNTTVVFGEETNGTPIEGDIAVDGNKVAIYGNGPDNTIIDGNVELDGNAVRLRGVTIMGDLIIRKNRAAVVLCRILGNVILEGESTNGSVFAENDVFGDFISDSNNNLIVGNDVTGEWSHGGNNNVCDRNARFTDADEDGLVAEGERAEPLQCTGGG